ncbi:TetR/AcrR family transcriptional regulator [Actinomadura litoris]|uniref:TetR/AcrR family transcriptional regulator n=1 Tax=Actinomadura litoris TaxID=2678616 RepID=UPI001FA72FDE|nr:TetR/AcrR family transcriptional regulator [Actinomadura litoris]
MTASRPPQSPDRTAVIMRTALDLAREVGYAKLSIEGIAARAGVGKHTVYRRWPSKGALFLDAMLSALQTELAYTDTGDIVDDLRKQMNAARELVGGPDFGPLYAALVGEAQHDPAIAEALYERWVEPITERTRTRLRAAQEQGQLSTEYDLDVIVALLYGPLYYRFLLIPGNYDAAFIDSVLRAAFAGLKP